MMTEVLAPELPHGKTAILQAIHREGAVGVTQREMNQVCSRSAGGGETGTGAPAPCWPEAEEPAHALGSSPIAF